MSIINGVCEFCGQTVFEGQDCDCIEAQIEKEKKRSFQ